ncbi:MAG: polysaccharide pyruvyl transferase family protein [Desulfobulbaceae bacterium]|nr:polysaccharide pyruvyl transferase family protein [Desulfobulbaceae bacterium]
MKKIGFIWHSLHTRNLGVGALSISNILIVSKILRDIGEEVEYVVFGPKGTANAVSIPELPPCRHVALSFDAMLGMGFINIFREMNSCDLVLDIGSGDSFSDIYGKKRFLKTLLSKYMMIDAGRKLILSPQTIGPFDNYLFRKISAHAMGRAMKVFARDCKSYAYVDSISGGSVSLELSSDIAMSLPHREVVLPALQRGNGVINIGLNISGLLYAGGYQGGNQFGLSVDYRQAMHDLARELSAEPGVCVWLVPHVFGSGGMHIEDDYAVSEEIAKVLPAVRVAPRFSEPIEAKSFISQMDFFVGARMHATIAAFSSGVPVIPLAYSRKFAGLYESLGYMRVIDMCEVNDAVELIEAVRQAFHQRDALRQEVVHANLKAQAALSKYQDYLREVLAGLAGEK